MEKNYAYTLENVKDVKASDLFFGTYTMITGDLIKKEDNDSTCQESLKKAISNLLSKSSNDKKKMEAIKESVSSIMLTTCPVTMQAITLKKDGLFIDVQDNKVIDMNRWQLTSFQRFSDYYKDGEFRFVEVDGKTELRVIDLEPYNRYMEKSKEMIETSEDVILTRK